MHLTKEKNVSQTPFSPDRYRFLVAENLQNVHGCPSIVVALLLDEYDDVVTACWESGVAAITPSKLLYAEWKVFRS
ncbi:hypothetical protein WK56_01650 [Burkholderia ubonensis]|nr:hypothetical protein WK56_01650 [Burkholderia ubonensis]